MMHVGKTGIQIHNLAVKFLIHIALAYHHIEKTKEEINKWLETEREKTQ